MEAFRFSLVENHPGRLGELLRRYRIIDKKESVEFYIGVIKEILEKPWLSYFESDFKEGLRFALFRVKKIDAGAVEKQLPEFSGLIKNKLVSIIDSLYSNPSIDGPGIDLGSEQGVLDFLISSFRLPDTVISDKKVFDALGCFEDRAKKMEQVRGEARWIQNETRKILALFK